MIEVTENANKAILEILSKQEKPTPIRILLQSSC
jgi:hypothetical protein